jgi:hypothetical protein
MTHVQLAFWNAKTQKHTTFSADKNLKFVHTYDEKTFSKDSWRFYRMRVHRSQEITMYRFLQQQIGKPFNLWGQLLCVLWPWSGRGESWFCSELVMATFQAAAKYPGFYPEETHPGQIHSILAHDKLVCQSAHIVLVNESKRLVLNF